MTPARLHLVLPEARPQPGIDMPIGGFIGALWAMLEHWRAGVPKPARKHMRVVETLTLAPRKQLFLVHCDGHRFLIGTGAEGIQTMTRVSSEPVVTQPGARQEDAQC